MNEQHGCLSSTRPRCDRQDRLASSGQAVRAGGQRADRRPVRGRRALRLGQPSSGVRADYAQVLRPLTATVASGNGARQNGDILTVTGTAPITFAEFAAKTAAAWN
jgi:hypothetical protein